MTTTRDVASLAGVSVATVSAVINGNKFVSPDLVCRVEKAIAALGYRPNLVARSLKSGRTRTLGVLIPNIRDPYWAEIVASIEDVARAEGYRIFLCDTEENPDTEEKSLRILAEMKVDGIAIVPTGNQSEQRVAPLLEAGIGVVAVARKLQGLDLDSVVSDNEMAGYLGTHHLLSLGYRRVGILAFPTYASAGRDRLSGYQRALAEAGIPVDPLLIQHGGAPLEERGYRAAEQLLKTPGVRPDAVVVCNHLMMLGLLKCLREQGVRVPEDVGLVGFDEYPWTPFMEPPLTVVQQLRSETGIATAKRLIARVRGEFRGPGEEISMPISLIVRKSCGSLLTTPAGDRAEISPR